MDERTDDFMIFSPRRNSKFSRVYPPFLSPHHFMLSSASAGVKYFLSDVPGDIPG
jgi:hypothetical protein